MFSVGCLIIGFGILLDCLIIVFCFLVVGWVGWFLLLVLDLLDYYNCLMLIDCRFCFVVDWVVLWFVVCCFCFDVLFCGFDLGWCFVVVVLVWVVCVWLVVCVWICLAGLGDVVGCGWLVVFCSCVF